MRICNNLTPKCTLVIICVVVLLGNDFGASLSNNIMFNYIASVSGKKSGSLTRGGVTDEEVEGPVMMGREM